MAEFVQRSEYRLSLTSAAKINKVLAEIKRFEKQGKEKPEMEVV